MKLNRTHKAIGALALVVLLAMPVWLTAQVKTQVTGGSTPGTLGAGRVFLGYGSPAAAIIGVSRVQMTNAQVLALLTTAVSILPAQGTGTITENLGGMIVFNYTTAYTETGANDNWRLYYGDSGKEPASNTIETTGFVDATADAIIKFGPVANDQVIQGAEMSNAAVVLSGVAGGNYQNLGGGNAANTVTVHMFYRVLSTGL